MWRLHAFSCVHARPLRRSSLTLPAAVQNKDEVLNTVRDVIAEQLGLKVDEVCPRTSVAPPTSWLRPDSKNIVCSAVIIVGTLALSRSILEILLSMQVSTDKSLTDLGADSLDTVSSPHSAVLKPNEPGSVKRVLLSSCLRPVVVSSAALLLVSTGLALPGMALWSVKLGVANSIPFWFSLSCVYCGHTCNCHRGEALSCGAASHVA